MDCLGKQDQKIRTLEEIDFWIGKRAQSGKKIPKYFNKNLKFYE